MRSALECQRHADDCDRLGLISSDGTNRHMLYAVAKMWRGLAGTTGRQTRIVAASYVFDTPEGAAADEDSEALAVPYRSRSDEYRQRADECRAKAATATDDHVRQMALQDADTWERMAKWEDANKLPPPVPPSVIVIGQ